MRRVTVRLPTDVLRRPPLNPQKRRFVVFVKSSRRRGHNPPLETPFRTEDGSLVGETSSSPTSFPMAASTFRVLLRHLQNEAPAATQAFCFSSRAAAELRPPHARGRAPRLVDGTASRKDRCLEAGCLSPCGRQRPPGLPQMGWLDTQLASP